MFDVSKAEQAKRLHCRGKILSGGGIDGLICNAGLSLHEESIGKVSPEQFDKQFNTNFRGAYFLAQAYVEDVTSSTKPSDRFLFVPRLQTIALTFHMVSVKPRLIV